VVGVEALVRWQHPTKCLLYPDAFIPLAEQTGIISALTAYVLDASLEQVRRWRDAGIDLAVSVNLSTHDLIDLRFPDEVEAVLRKWSVPGENLELEITESLIMADPMRAQLVLVRLHELGIRLAVDDFGTAYSSLSYLKRLPVDEIKIDKSFVINMPESDSDEAIVRSTIDLSRNLGLDVVAEGIESEIAWDRLASLGCTAGQGYYLSRPLPATDLVRWLAHHPADPAKRRSA
jgi:EAL domain-containing protein (putative c-di-GMP-specific phosphodiesterase class I)